MIDLQSHSTFSDGELSPSEVVRLAAEAGVTTLALTDHDSVDGVPEAAAAAEDVGIELIPAAEMSSVHPVCEDLHILGYWIDIEAMRSACARAQEERVERARQIVDRLVEHGVEVSFDDAIAEAGDASSVGRPHIARAAGVPKDEMSPFFEEYLVPGAKAFVARTWPTSAEACELIRDAGGSVVLAHPFWDLDDPQVVEELIADLPLDGVEVFYPSHTREQTEFLLGICAREGLRATASADFHGPGNKNFHTFGAYSTYDLGQPELPPPGSSSRSSR